MSTHSFSIKKRQQNEFQLYHELMPNKVRNILLVSSPYDAWVMEEDGKLSEQLISEYRGLNLSSPPRLHWASSSHEALMRLQAERFDMIIIMPSCTRAEDIELATRIKEHEAELPVVLLPHNCPALSETPIPECIDWYAAWTGNAELLLALVKLAEDSMNWAHDCLKKGIRAIIVAEDSPHYLAATLPILYREVVIQTQGLQRKSINQEHRLLTMRARPKVIAVRSYEKAVNIFDRSEQCVLGVISDVRFHREGILDGQAGVDFLAHVKKNCEDIPLLLFSSEPQNAEKAKKIPASFLDKNSVSLLTGVRDFICDQLGFGSFIFRDESGAQTGVANTLFQFEKALRTLSDDTFAKHVINNDFSRWFFARTEIDLAKTLRPLTGETFGSYAQLRRHIIKLIRKRRLSRREGVIVTFMPDNFDPATSFYKLGAGSIGGKARGLAFLNSLLSQHKQWIQETYPDITIRVPNALALATGHFDAFLRSNKLEYLFTEELPDEAINQLFSRGDFLPEVEESLAAYLKEVTCPLAVRSSSLLEDAQFQAYAGLYSTIVLPNAHSSFGVRLRQLMAAIKMVYASTFYTAPKSFSRRVKMRTDEEKMGVVIQQAVGQHYDDRFYPTLAGVAQSHNFYPFGRMKAQDGLASIVTGFGSAVVEGGRCLRFCPAKPHIQPEFLTVQEVLKNAQRDFYFLDMAEKTEAYNIQDHVVMADIHSLDETPLRFAASTYSPQEGQLRESLPRKGEPRVITFAPVLKHRLFPLASLLRDFLKLLEQGMGAPIEMEFAVDLYPEKDKKPSFNLLQVRPMNARTDHEQVTIQDQEKQQAFCLSSNALGNVESHAALDIVFVRPQTFNIQNTPEMAREIGEINRELFSADKKYLLIGPGRWGSSDRWLGIPVQWDDIAGVSAIIETSLDALKVDFSQGSHFFHNITTLGIPYIVVDNDKGDYFDWQWLTRQPVVLDKDYVCWARTQEPVTIKVDGRSGLGIIC